MKLIRLAFVTVLFLFLVTASSHAQDWKTYSYPSEGFHATFPLEPESSTQSVPTDNGTFDLHIYMAQTSGDTGAAFFVGVCDYGSATAGKNRDELLKNSENGALANSKSHLVGSDRKIILDGVYPGLAFESETDALHMSARFYMVGNVLYETLIVSAPAETRHADADRFLDSFDVIH